jgi:hypothetical protein
MKGTTMTSYDQFNQDVKRATRIFWWGLAAFAGLCVLGVFCLLVLGWVLGV